MGHLRNGRTERFRMHLWQGLAWLAALSLTLQIASAQQSGGAFPYGVAAGDVTDSAAVLWTCTTSPGTVTCEVSRTPDFAEILLTQSVQTDESSGLTVKVRVEGLQPRTRYYYRFRLADEPDVTSRIGTFVTAPADDQEVEFTFAFSGDSSSLYQPFVLLAGLADDDPAFFIYCGEKIYADMSGPPAQSLEEYRAKYLENRNDPYLQDLLARTAVWAMWDDHEVLNNYSGASDPDAVDLVQNAYQAFFDCMPIRQTDGFRTYRSLRYGKLAEFFFLDCRQYRSSTAADICHGHPDPQGVLLPPDADCLAALEDASNSMLGEEQLNWLLQGLKNSTARYKFIISSVPMLTMSFLPYDRWDGYAGERLKIFQFIAENHITGVFVLSADAHLNAFAPDSAYHLKGPLHPELSATKIKVPEFVVGPMAAGTFRRELTWLVPQLFGVPADSPIIGDLLEIAFDAASRYIVQANDLAYFEPDRFAYLLVHVGRSKVNFKFRMVAADATAPEDIETPYQVSIAVLQGNGMPCMLLPLPFAAVALIALRRWA